MPAWILAFGAAGVEDRIRFLTQDLFATDLRGVSVVMLFLSPQFNLRLRPKLVRALGLSLDDVTLRAWKPLRSRPGPTPARR